MTGACDKSLKPIDESKKEVCLDPKALASSTELGELQTQVSQVLSGSELTSAAHVGSHTGAASPAQRHLSHTDPV